MLSSAVSHVQWVVGGLCNDNVQGGEDNNGDFPLIYINGDDPLCLGLPFYAAPATFFLTIKLSHNAKSSQLLNRRIYPGKKNRLFLDNQSIKSYELPFMQRFAQLSSFKRCRMGSHDNAAISLELTADKIF